MLLAACAGSEQAERLAPIDLAAGELRDAYIVVMHGTASAGRAGANRAAAADVAKAYGLVANRTYGAALVGFAAHVPEGRLAALQRDPRVAYVERDAEVTIFAQETPTGVRRVFAPDNTSIGIDGSDDRVDVDVAVIDTGVDFEHPDLNVAGGVDCTVATGGGPPWARTYECSETGGTGGDDDHYHGTHVAGTIAALDNGIGVVGVAPGARVWAVKVLDSQGSGYTSGIVAGIDWVAARAGTIEVANMSLGGTGFSQAQYDAIQGAVNAGVAFAVAAGNSDDDASNYSPAGFDNVLTVSALADFDGEPGGNGAPTCRTDQDDTLADFSNWGSAVDIAAPGVCILSTYPIEQGSYGTISGTSMASPHVAGALALLASASKPVNANDVENLYTQVENAGNPHWTDDSGDGVKEPLLDLSNTTLFAPVLVAGGGGGGTTNTPPSVTVSSPADGASFESGTSISFTGAASDHEDGDLTAYLAWASDVDGTIGTGGSFSAVLSDGTHVITASVTDSGGSTGSDVFTITVEGPATGDFNLSATGYKVKGRQSVDLTWSGATSANVDVHRDGVTITTTANDGAYTDNIGNVGGGSYTYQVCEAGTTTCSNEVAVTF